MKLLRSTLFTLCALLIKPTRNYYFYQRNPEVSVLIDRVGVNGIGTFHDLALQGVDALNVEWDDFYSEPSAASSHMVRGGICYLVNGVFRLVREAVLERLLSKSAKYG